MNFSWINVKSKINAVLKKVADISDYIFNLIVVFILQTVIIPILVLCALIKISSYIIGKTFSSEMEQKLKEILRKPMLENRNKEATA